ncbi:hypothetical protein BJY01DRAFT_222707 [Aspergillus pseudoustus]|uniref:Rhodopsin domain-containing protein n=1 Tax=Aspergillus pseudoustus TaxID=1810923 RepID=A0ABR4J7Q0_9EURO
MDRSPSLRDLFSVGYNSPSPVGEHDAEELIDAASPIDNTAVMTLNAAQKTNLSVTWILGGLATSTVFARLYVRFFVQHSPGGDDYAMILSWCLAATSASLASVAIHYGLGMDLNDIQPPDARVDALKYLTLAPSPSILSVAVGKLSIILFFHRLLGMSMTRTLSVALWTLIFITFCLSVAAVLAVLAFCIPTQSIWDRTVASKWCMAPETQLGIGLSQASFNASTDILLGLLPAYSFWNLQMPFRRKVGLMLLFGVGVFGCVITSIKAYQLRNLTGHDNLTKSWSPITIWNTYFSLFLPYRVSRDRKHKKLTRCPRWWKNPYLAPRCSS